MKREKIDIIRAVMLGHAVADAVGVPAEFRSRGELRSDPITDMTGYGTHYQPKGTFSDDTSMSIAALDAIKGGELDYLGVMKNFSAWYNRSEYTASGVFFDIGNSCLRAISSFDSDGEKRAFGHGETGAYSCGNGGLMRIHPFALYAFYKEEDTGRRMKIVHDGTALTHAHPRCLLGSGIFSLILGELIRKPEKASVTRGAASALLYYSKAGENGSPELSGEIQTYKRVFKSLATVTGCERTTEDEIRSTGYVVDTLEAAMWCIMSTNDYKSAVLRAVNLGEDTDTVAAVAGALAGALYGVEGIPEEWLRALVGRDMIEDMCETFAENI